MSNMIIHSVVIPHYTKSGTALLERAVTSVPDRADIEVIVVDNSPEEININLFNDRSNVQIAYSDKRKGAGCARNRGIELARGKWLHFLDADDFYTENAFNEFDRYKDSDFDIIFFKMTSCYSDTLEPAHRHIQHVKAIDDFLQTGNEKTLRYGYEVPWAKMVCSEMVYKHNIRFEEIRFGNDAMFGLLIGINAQKIWADSSVVSCVTINKGSLTNIKSLSDVQCRFEGKVRMNRVLKEHGLPRTKSVIKYPLFALNYGISPFYSMLKTSIQERILFVGWKNWIKTALRMLFKSDNKNKYKESE